MHGVTGIVRFVSFETFDDLPIQPGDSRTFSFSLRWSVYDALAELGDKDAVPALLDSMETLYGTPAETSRRKVVEALGRLGSPLAVSALVKAMRHKDYENQRTRIGDALSRITGFDGGPDSIYELKTWQDWTKNHP